MASQKEIEIVKKAVTALRANTEFWMGRSDLGVRSDALTIESFSNMAGNHVFDDQPEKFGLEKIEAHILRGYFQNNTNGQLEKSLAFWSEEFKDCGFDTAEIYTKKVLSKGLTKVMDNRGYSVKFTKPENILINEADRENVRLKESQELLPCGFCGNKSVLIAGRKNEDSGLVGYIAWCDDDDDCGASIGFTLGDMSKADASRKKVVEAWNRIGKRRIEEEKKVQLIATTLVKYSNFFNGNDDVVLEESHRKFYNNSVNGKVLSVKDESILIKWEFLKDANEHKLNEFNYIKLKT